jgi:hypothetical protein
MSLDLTNKGTIVTNGSAQLVIDKTQNAHYDVTVYTNALSGSDVLTFIVNLWDSQASAFRIYLAAGVVTAKATDADKAKKFNWTFTTRFKFEIQQTAGTTGKSINYEVAILPLP